VTSDLALAAAKEALKRVVLAILTISFIFELERECSNGSEQPAIVTPPQNLMTARSVDDPFFAAGPSTLSLKRPAALMISATRMNLT
jgi:hypothetical protein